MEKTFYGQFMPGASHDEVIILAQRLASSDIRFIATPSIEDELEENESHSGNNRFSCVYLCCVVHLLLVLCICIFCKYLFTSICV